MKRFVSSFARKTAAYHSSASSGCKGLFCSSYFSVLSVLASSSKTRPISLQQQQLRAVWSSGQDQVMTNHPLASLTPEEIEGTAKAVKSVMGEKIRFITITLAEPSKYAPAATKRKAEVIILKDGIATELTVILPSFSVETQKTLPPGVQPMFTPEDCDLAEEIVHNSPQMQDILKERYGITDCKAQVAADPWSIHLADANDEALTMSEDGKPRRLVQTFLYQRINGDIRDNHYAHPLDIVPVVDLNSNSVVKIDGLDRDPPQIPKTSVNYNRDLLSTNSYLQTAWRSDTLKALNITQPDGPSFTVTDGNLVEWQGWSLRVGFNYREGLVLHDVQYHGRPIARRASLVEMSVPYADPNPPFQRKCALDVGDYGLGYCANSLELGCDCLGHIHYFDAILNDVAGNPKLVKKVICMHEEDSGLLWKHVEYRNGHNESRRARELVLSSIATVVNYEYLFYWRLKMDGSIDFEIRLSGELSTNLPSQDEDWENPGHGTLVAPGVNAQIHQHMFCARLDMNVDGNKNTVSEIDVETAPSSPENPFGNIFHVKERRLETEHKAVRVCDSTKARTWKIANAEGKLNPITNKPTAYKLIPFTRGPAQPPLLTHLEDCAVSKKSKFATANLWVTQYDEKERYPAGDYPTQATMHHVQESGGLPQWVESRNANLADGNDIVLWHSFGVTHIPRVEDFPVMPCEITGFTLKPDGFFAGNPAIDAPPEINKKSALASGCCSK